MSASSPTRPRWLVVLLVLLPLWLLLSAGAAVWNFLQREREDEEVEQRRFATAVSHGALADDLRKIVTIIGERHGASESAANNLTRCALMIEGVLGPSNTGYTVRRERGRSGCRRHATSPRRSSSGSCPSVTCSSVPG